MVIAREAIPEFALAASARDDDRHVGVRCTDLAGKLFSGSVRQTQIDDHRREPGLARP